MLNSYGRILTMAPILIAVHLLMITVVLAVDGCHQWGAPGVCCDNSGYGPNCVYCAGVCTPNVKGASCSTGCGTTTDCSSQLTAQTSPATMTISGFGGVGTRTETWSTYFYNAAPTNCPVHNCRFVRWGGSGTSIASTTASWGVYFDSVTDVN